MRRNRKRTRRELNEGVQNAYERRGLLNHETIAYGDGWIMPDERYPYRQPWYMRFATGIGRALFSVLSPIALKLAFGARVEGKENLKELHGSGAITICNHIHYLDTLFVRQAVVYWNTFHTIAPFNNKGGIAGFFIRLGATWPFSADLNAMRNLHEEMDRQLKRGKRINFYPEYAMWWSYQKPRPMKDSAFHYAVKFGVPVLPVFCTFEKTKKCGIRKLCIHILPAVYADDTLPKKERIQAMRDAAQEEWKECYEKAYGVPLEYLTE